MSQQMSALTQELSECKRIAEDHRLRFREMEEQLDTLRDAQVPSGSGSAAAEADMTLIRDELHRQAEYMAKLEKTNTRLEAELGVLRKQHTSVEVLREEKRVLEKKARMFDDAQERAVRLEEEVEAGKKEREQWCVSSTTQYASYNSACTGESFWKKAQPRQIHPSHYHKHCQLSG
jgi:mitotic spindle assembly checkpoint protein MAD1